MDGFNMDGQPSPTTLQQDGMDALQSREQISASIGIYRIQLKEIEEFLDSNPSHVDSLKMKDALIEIIQLSNDILGTTESLEISKLTVVDAQPESEAETPTPSEISQKRKLCLSNHDSSIPCKKPDRRGMNPKNNYAENIPDFLQLAESYPSLRPYVTPPKDRKGRGKIDWTSFDATRELTRALLHQDFGIKWWIPDGHLCPPIPNRSNYIHWIHDLLTLSQKTEGCVRGVDIGTGASCIYPLLGAALYGWLFVATDVTEVAITGASQNLTRNPEMAGLIEIRRSGKAADDPAECPLLVGVLQEGEQFQFCMCNPPFFESEAEANANPRTSCGGSITEMVYPGVPHPLVRLQQTVFSSWYTSMVGKKRHVKTLMSILRKHKATVVKSTEFGQGRTSRWGIAWSFSEMPDSLRSSARVAPCLAFQLQGIGRGTSAWDIFQSMASKIQTRATLIAVDQASFSITAALLSPESGQNERNLDSSVKFKLQLYQQAPGSVSITCKLLDACDNSAAVKEFSSIIHWLESEFK